MQPETSSTTRQLAPLTTSNIDCSASPSFSAEPDSTVNSQTLSDPIYSIETRESLVTKNYYENYYKSYNEYSYEDIF